MLLGKGGQVGGIACYYFLLLYTESLSLEVACYSGYFTFRAWLWEKKLYSRERGDGVGWVGWQEKK